MRGQAVPEVEPDKPFAQSEPKDLPKLARIKLKSCDFHPYPGGDRVVRNDPPGEIRPGPKQNSDAIHPEKEGYGDTSNRMEAQEWGEPDENAQSISESRSLRGVFDMEKLSNQTSETVQPVAPEK